MTAIVDIVARQIFDSRGNPTVEVDVILEDGSMGRAAASVADGRARGGGTPRRRQVPLPGQGRHQGGGRGQRRNPRAHRGHGCRGPDRHRRGDDRTRWTPNKGRLGANAILGVSLAVAKAAAETSGLPSTAMSAAPRRASCPCR